MNKHQHTYIHLCSHFECNVSSLSSSSTSPAIWINLITVLFTSVLTSHPIFRLPQLIQHRRQYEQTSAQFCSSLFSLRIQRFDSLNYFNIAGNMNKPQHNSIYLCSHSECNVSTSLTDSASHCIWAVLTTVLFTSFLTSHAMFRLPQLIQHNIPYEYSSRQFCSHLFSFPIECSHVRR